MTQDLDIDKVYSQFVTIGKLPWVRSVCSGTYGDMDTAENNVLFYHVATQLRMESVCRGQTQTR